MLSLEIIDFNLSPDIKVHRSSNKVNLDQQFSCIWNLDRSFSSIVHSGEEWRSRAVMNAFVLI